MTIRLLAAVVLVVVGLAGLAGPASPAQAAPLDVCPSGCSYSSIQAAIDAATSGDTIAIGAGTYVERLTISKSLTLTGAGAESTIIDGNDGGSVVLVDARVNAATVTIGGVTIQNGNAASGGGGGGIYNRLGTLTLTDSVIRDNTANYGGGVSNSGTLTVSTSTVSGNSALYGGGVQNNGTLIVTASTFNGNRTDASGGGINNDETATITNSTFSGNSANFGGGLRTDPDSTSIISHTTISGNSANISGGGIIISRGASATIANSIVANNTSGNCGGEISDGGGNLSWPDASCPGLNADPLLGPLQDNGGPTPTMTLLPGSPAIDAAVGCPTPATDQRGMARPQGAACDSGAVEVVDDTPPSITPNVSGTLGNNGWYTSEVTVSWTVEDAQSRVTDSDGCDATPITADATSTTLTCTAGSVGGEATRSITVKRDATAPALAPTVSPNPVALNEATTASANATDATSGVATQSCDPVDTSSVGEQSVTCTATDVAGNTATATASYTVVNPDSTAPFVVASVKGDRGTNGWYQDFANLTWTVFDDESEVLNTEGCEPVSVVTDTPGTTFTCTATSAGGTASASVTIKRDATLPVLAPTVSPNPVAINQPAMASANATDATSGIASQNCATPDTSTVGEHTVTCTATDNAGNTATAGANYTVTDPSAPIITPDVGGTLGDNDWYISDVTVTWTIEDAESEIMANDGCDQVTVTDDTTGTTFTCSATSAGGTASESVTIQRDATAPVITYTGNQGTYGLLDTVEIDCAASDATSGIASDTCQNVSAPASSFGPGEHVITAGATDLAGNTGSAETRFVVAASYDGLCALTKELVSHRATERAACTLLTAAKRAEQRGQASVAEGLLAGYRVTITVAIQLGHVSAVDGQTLIDWSRAL